MSWCWFLSLTQNIRPNHWSYIKILNHFSAGDKIFDEVPAVLCPHDRRFCCFHCCKPIESVNQAVQRMAKDPKLKFFQIIPTEKKPDIIIDDITKAWFWIQDHFKVSHYPIVSCHTFENHGKLRFCCAECYKAAMDSYFATFRGKWLQYRNIEDWIIRNKVFWVINDESSVLLSS